VEFGLNSAILICLYCVESLITVADNNDVDEKRSGFRRKINGAVDVEWRPYSDSCHVAARINWRIIIISAVG